jgi:DNA-binding GntR family transcriptional regulator
VGRSTPAKKSVPPGETRVEPKESHISAIGAANLREQVRRALEAAIVAGELEPGALYSAVALGERFGVSATPVREAMLELSKDGFVVAERNRGFRVLEVSERDLYEISDIRLLLEVPSTVKVAAIIESEVLDRLAEIAGEISAAAAAGELIPYLDLDRRFHVDLISRLGNNRLTDLVDLLRRQTRLFGLDQLVESGRLVESAHEHHDLIEAMRARDEAATEGIITTHIKHTRGLWVGRSET